MLSPTQIDLLKRQGFSSGLIQAFERRQLSCPLSIWILDNSRFMLERDSHILREKGGGANGDYQSIDATRWEELQDCVAYHSYMAATFGMPMRFALLNNPEQHGFPQYMSLAQQQHGQGTPSSGNIQLEYQTLQRVMTTIRPAGPTPLTAQLTTLREYIVSIAEEVRARNHVVTIVLATQGLPTNERGEVGPAISHEFLVTLKSLEGLPVWLVIRLCTDDERAFEFYNSIDGLSMPFEVLDDYNGEALEVYLRNPWLTYGLALHRIREIGFHVAVLDILDERALTILEIRDLVSFLFETKEPLPDPTKHWNEFFRAVSNLMAVERQPWNPVTKQRCPWIRLGLLDRLYRPTVPGQAMPMPPSYPPYYYQKQQQQQHYSNPATAKMPFQGPTTGSVPPTSQRASQPYSYSAPSAPPPRLQAQGTPQPYAYPIPPPQRTPQPYSYTAPPQAPQPYSHSSPPQAPQPTLPATSQPVVSVPAPVPQQMSKPTDAASLKKAIREQWAMQPPLFTAGRPIGELLVTLRNTFTLVDHHDYFAKYHPFNAQAFAADDEALLKRAVRKTKFFLHPDKLPKDFNQLQALLCKILWDTIAEAWEAFEK